MRVHQLAKQLQLNSKELISNLKDIGIEVNSHMSSLTEKQVEEIRERLTKTVKESIVEKRVTKTVIRRRKKVEVIEPSPPPPGEEEVLKEQEKEKPVQKELISEKKQPAPEESAKEQGKPAPASIAEKKEEKKEGPKPKQKKLKKSREETPARIIDRVELKTFTPREKAPLIPAEGAKGKDKKLKKSIIVEEMLEAFKDRESEKERPKKRRFRRQKDTLYDSDDFETIQGLDTQIRHKIIKGKITQKKKRAQEPQIPSAKKKPLSLVKPKKPEITVPKPIKRKIRIHEGITVGDLAKRMGVKASEVIKKLMELGLIVTINQVIDADSATLVGTEFGYEVENVPIEEEQIFEEKQDLEKTLLPRCPIVTVMGHVDHGKTSLLDAIRETNVAEGEKGGITQHIGAYRVSTDNGDIVFIDTPGHEAFTAMRARGAQITDIVVLVVAADEGVKPQTIEAINHSQSAGVPIIVAINKMDKPEANPERIKQELTEYGLVHEDWGGDTIFVEISAKKRQGIDKLLELILLQAEMLELKANPDKPAKGVIIEAKVDRGRGAIATVLIREGTLKIGDSFVSKFNFGKVRAMIDDRGKQVKQAGPSTPVEILGFSGIPHAGDVFTVVDEEKKARQAGLYWQQKKREEELVKNVGMSLESFYESIKEKDVKELKIVLKADVQGSIEALKQSLTNLNTDEVRLSIIHSSVGSINQSDIMLASASSAIVIGFGVKTEPKIFELAEREKVEIRLYNVIYDVIDNVEKAMTGMLKPRIVEKLAGKAEVKQVFTISKLGTVAGSVVIEGKIVKGTHARLIRNQNVIHEGQIVSLRRYKDEAKEVFSGQECGIFFGNFKEIQAGDIIESILLEEVAPKLHK